MEQWEYVIMQVNRGDVSKQVERLCEAGAEGWELVAVVPKEEGDLAQGSYGMGFTAWLKRRKRA